MQEKAFNRAVAAFNRAAAAQNFLVSHDQYPPSAEVERYREAWADVLIHGKHVIHRLAAGAKHPATRLWFDGVRRMLKSDELLVYMAQARDVETHGIETSAGDKVAARIWVINSGLPVPDMAALERDEEGLPILPTYAVPAGSSDQRFVSLLPVTSRGVTYQRPSTHLGGKIEDDGPPSVAGLYLTYLRTLLDQARVLVVKEHKASG